MEQQHKRGAGVEPEGRPLMSHQRSPSPLLARQSEAAPPSPTLSSYQSFPRTSISYSSSASPAPPHHSAQGVLARLNNFLRLAKPLGKEAEDEGRADGCGWFYCGWRARLGHWLEGRRVQYFFISLLVLDIVLLTCELAFEEYFADEDGEEWILITKEVFEYASVSILLVFAVEVVLLVIAFDLAFFTHPFYVIDAIIIGVSLFFDLYLKEALAGFLVVFRFWRVVRVVHSIVAAEEERHGETKREKRRLEEEVRDYQETIADLQRRLEAKDWALERLREKCAALEQRQLDPLADNHRTIPCASSSSSSQSSPPSLSAQLPASAT